MYGQNTFSYCTSLGKYLFLLGAPIACWFRLPPAKWELWVQTLSDSTIFDAKTRHHHFCLSFLEGDLASLDFLLKAQIARMDGRNQKSAWSQAPNSQGHRACDVGAGWSGRREEGSYSFWIADRWVRPSSSVLHVVAANFLTMAVLEKCHRPKGLLKWNPLAVINLIFWSKKGNGGRTSILKRLYTSKGIHFQLIFRTLYLHFQSQHSQSKLQSNASLLRSEFNKVV